MVRSAAKNLIEFTITDYRETITYQSEEGMTWEEWVNSDYNPGKWMIIENDITLGVCGSVKYNDILVRPSEVIDKKNYTITTCSN